MKLTPYKQKRSRKCSRCHRLTAPGETVYVQRPSRAIICARCKTSLQAIPTKSSTTSMP